MLGELPPHDTHAHEAVEATVFVDIVVVEVSFYSLLIISILVNRQVYLRRDNAV